MNLRRPVTLLLMSIAAAAQGQSGSADGPAVVEAKANRARMTVAPRIAKDGLDALDARVEAERAMGHHGLVMVEGVLGVDGRVAEPRIRVSSRAPELDRIALEAARTSILSPARDASGAAIPVWMARPFEFQNRAYAERGGLKDYRCREFVEDIGWWRTTWPERPWSQYEFYLLMRGFGTVRALGQGDRKEAERTLAATDFDARWKAALDRCAAKPASRFVETSGLMDR